MAILSKYPVTELFYEMPPAGWFHGQAVKVATSQGDIKLLNIHLRPPASGKGGLTYLNYFRLPKIHPQEMEHLYKILDERGGKIPAIVLGDFNESDKGSAMNYLRQKGMADALQSFDASTNTWHGKLAGIALAERCDHILFSSEFRCVDAAVLKEGKSDHYPVIGVFQLKP